MEKAIFLLRPRVHHIAQKTQCGDKAKASGVSVTHSHFQFTFSKVCLFNLVYSATGEQNNLLRLVELQNSLLLNTHTQIHPV